MKKHSSISLISLIMALLLSSFVCAEDLKIEAYTDKTTVSAGETFELNVTVRGASDSEVNLPQTEHYSIVSRSSYMQTEIINFKVSQQSTYKYTLIPHKEGRLSIEPIKIITQDKEYYAKPVVIQVTHKKKEQINQHNTYINQRTEKKQRTRIPRHPIFNLPEGSITAKPKINKTEYYLGEQIPLDLDLLSESDSILPERSFQISGNSKNLITEELKGAEYITLPDEGEERAATRVKFALYPLTQGMITIAPFKVAYMSLMGQRMTSSEPIGIYIKPLPPLPAEFGNNFSGGVGKFNLTTEVENGKFKENKPFIVKVKAKGIGNASLITLKINDIEGVERFDTSEKVSKTIIGNDIEEEKCFTITYIPRKSGEISIPSCKMVFFDPELGKYYQKESRVHNIYAVKSEVMKENTNKKGSEQKITSQNNEKSIKTNFYTISPFKIYRNLYIIIASFTPSIIFIGTMLLKKMGSNHINPQKDNNSYKKLKSILKKAGNTSGYSIISKELSEFLSAKLKLEEGYITKRSIIQKIREKWLEDPIASEIEDIFNQCDQANFTASKKNAPDKQFIARCIEAAGKIESRVQKEKKI